MRIRLIGLDLDETLLRRDKSISAHTVEVIERACTEYGVTVVPVTGRPLDGLPANVRSIRGIRYAITSNGAVTTELATGRRLRECLMEASTVSGLIRLKEDEEFCREVFMDDHGFCTHPTLRRHEMKYAGTAFLDYIRGSRAVVGDLCAFVDLGPDRFENVCFISEDAGILTDIHAAAAEYVLTDGGRLNITHTMPRVIEISAPGADKGQALLALGEMLGIDADGIMAVGDSDNDAGLLRAVGYPVAMGNATADIKSIAKFITADNEHDGVAAAIERVFMST